MTATPVKKEFRRPCHPDGHQYHPDCCAKPDLWKYSDGKVRCRVCGDQWTDAVED